MFLYLKIWFLRENIKFKWNYLGLKLLWLLRKRKCLETNIHTATPERMKWIYKPMINTMLKWIPSHSINKTSTVWMLWAHTSRFQDDKMTIDICFCLIKGKNKQTKMQKNYFLGYLVQIVEDIKHKQCCIFSYWFKSSKWTWRKGSMLWDILNGHNADNR